MAWLVHLHGSVCPHGADCVAACAWPVLPASDEGKGVGWQLHGKLWGPVWVWGRTLFPTGSFSLVYSLMKKKGVKPEAAGFAAVLAEALQPGAGLVCALCWTAAPQAVV